MCIVNSSSAIDLRVLLTTALNVKATEIYMFQIQFLIRWKVKFRQICTDFQQNGKPKVSAMNDFENKEMMEVMNMSECLC